MCMCVAISKQAYLATKKQCYQERKKGASFLRIVTEKYRCRWLFFFIPHVFLCFHLYFRRSNFVSLSRACHCSTARTQLAGIGLILPYSFSSSPPPEVAALCPSGPNSQPWIHPIGGEVRWAVRPHCWPVKTGAVVSLLPVALLLLSMFFWRVQQ